MELVYSGERFMPGFAGPGIHLEHLHRYFMAAAMVKGAVLDVGCGVGYGSRLLARAARRVVGVDSSPPSVGFARDRFAAPRVDYLVGDARSLPFPSATFDWVVCFELIEHVREGEAVVAEIARVLNPGGQLLLSTPNRPVYSEVRGISNPFHPREFDTEELRALLSAAFGNVVLFGQRLVAGSAAWDIGQGAPPRSLETFQPDPELGPGLRPDEGPTYLLALCARRRGRRRQAACESVMPGRLEAFIEEQAAQHQALVGEEAARRQESEAGIRAEYQAVVDGLTAQLGAFDARIRELGGLIDLQNAARQQELGRLTDELAEERLRKVGLEEQAALRQQAQAGMRAEYESVVDRLTRQLGQFDARIRQLGAQIDLQSAARQQEVARLSDEIAQERSTRASLEQQRATLEQRHATLEQERGGLERQGNNLEETIRRLKAESEALESEVARLASEGAAWREKSAALDAALVEALAAQESLAVGIGEHGRQAGELRATVERTRIDLDWCYRQWQARESELDAMRRSKTWRLLLASQNVRSAIRSRYTRVRNWPSIGAERARLLAQAALRAPSLALGWLYLAAWTAVALAGAAWRRRARTTAGKEQQARAVPSAPTRRPRILVVCPYPLYPAHHGGGVRIFNLIRRLSRQCDIHLLAFVQGDDDPDQRQALEPWVQKLYFHRWQPRLQRDAWGLKPRACQLFEAPEVSWLVNEILSRERIDVLQLEYTEMGQYGLPPYARVKVVLTEIDITFRSRARRRRAGMHRRYASDRLFGHSLADWMRQFRYELTVARRADQVHVMSETDAAYLARFLPGGRRRIRVVPNAVDIDEYRPPDEALRRGRHLLFVGNFQHLPNLDALDYLMAEVWPLVRRRVPDAELWVVGAQGGEPVQRYDGREGVTVVGTVAETRPYYQRCRALVAPIRAGSGTRLKILEALACATPVATTTIGAEGIEGASERHFLVADTAAALAAAVCRLLEDDDLCERLGRAGRALVEDRYGWEHSAAAAAAGYADLLPDAVSGAGDARERPAPAHGAVPGAGAVDVSVVIPTLYGGAVFERCLAAVGRQRTHRSVEVVCVDSGSSAADLAAMERHGARVIRIERSEFNHGLTRDLGAAESRGRVLVFINQDAVPRDEEWLEGLTAPLFGENGCVAVQGGILESPDAAKRFYWDSCGERFYFTRESKRWIERYFGIGFSTVNAAMRREAWERYPFGYAPIMEDKKWQRTVVAAGHGIALAPQAVVIHTHNYSLGSLMRRCESEGYGWRTLGEAYSLSDLLSDVLRPPVYADLLDGLSQGRIRSWAEFLFPVLRPLMLFRGNRWGRAVRH